MRNQVVLRRTNQIVTAPYACNYDYRFMCGNLHILELRLSITVLCAVRQMTTVLCAVIYLHKKHTRIIE